MATIFVVSACQSKAPLIARAIKYYAQSLLEKDQQEDIVIVSWSGQESVISLIRSIGLRAEDCEFIFCALSTVKHFASVDGPFSGLQKTDDYFIGSTQELQEKKISGLHIDHSGYMGLTVSKCPIENMHKVSDVHWEQPLETLYISNIDPFKYFYNIKPIADNSDLNVFVQKLKEEGRSIIRFKKPTILLNSQSMNQLLIKINFEKHFSECEALNENLIKNNNEPAALALEAFLQTITQAKIDWNNTPQNWKTFTKTCQKALDIATKSDLQSFSEWNLLAQGFISAINWITHFFMNEPVFKTAEYAKICLFNQVIQSIDMEVDTAYLNSANLEKVFLSTADLI